MWPDIPSFKDICIFTLKHTHQPRPYKISIGQMQSAEYQFGSFQSWPASDYKTPGSNLKRCPLGRTIMKGWHTVCQVEDRPHFSAHLLLRLGAQNSKTLCSCPDCNYQIGNKVKNEKTKAIINVHQASKNSHNSKMLV